MDASSHPRRIVLLVDLHPLLNPNSSSSYVSSILHSATKVLTFPPLSTSLFTIKPFFSSLTPFKSTSLVHRLLGKSAAASPSFDVPERIVLALVQTMKSLSFPDEFDRCCGPPRAELVAGTLHELGLRCNWDEEGGLLETRPNLVMLFSPLPRSKERVAEFVNVWVEDDSMVNVDSFCDNFCRFFSCASSVFVRSDVYLSWIDVDFGIEDEGEIVGLDLLKRGIASMGWGFCSTDAIVLGSVLVPFGLIFPEIGSKLVVQMNEGRSNRRAEFALEISDSSGRPLEVKFCDLEILEIGLQKGQSEIASIFSFDDGDVKARICLKSVWRVGDSVSLSTGVCTSFLLHTSSGKNGDNNKDIYAEFWADKVLKLLDTKDSCKFVPGRPFWQLVLSFLYRRKLWGSVSISGRNGDHLIGIIKPFTIHSGLLSVLHDAKEPSDISKLLCVHSAPKTNSLECLAEKGKKSKKRLDTLSELSWSSFRESIFCQTYRIAPGVDLEEVYYGKEKNITKKMRFLQVWMKQMKKHDSHFQLKVSSPPHQPYALFEAEDRVLDTQQEKDILSSPPLREPHLNQPKLEEHPVSGSMEHLESFSEKISEKIEEGLCSKEMDLRQLAERLVELAIHSFYIKFKNDKMGDLDSEGTEDIYDQEIAAEVMKALFTKPKVLASKYKNPVPLATTSNQASDICIKKVREHELQILFRMEILRSSIGAWIEENARAKIIKDICLLLENIEFNLQGGLFAGESLFEFSNRTLKARYFHSLEDVIQRIYTQMEFLYFDGDKDGDSAAIPSSSNNDETPLNMESNSISNDATVGPNENVKVEDEISMVKNSDQHHNGYKVARANESELVKAQEKRERDRTNKRFTSWMPNLQIVYASKLSKRCKPVNGLVSHQTRKKRSHSSRNDMVLETPLQGKTGSKSQEFISIEKDGRGRNGSKRHVTKLLFPDEDDAQVTQPVLLS